MSREPVNMVSTWTAIGLPLTVNPVVVTMGGPCWPKVMREMSPAGAGTFSWGGEGLGEVQDASGIVELHDAIFEGTVGQGAIDVGKRSVVERRAEVDGEEFQAP